LAHEFKELARYGGERADTLSIFTTWTKGRATPLYLPRNNISLDADF
jgi:hypothetical protein